MKIFDDSYKYIIVYTILFTTLLESCKVSHDSVCGVYIFIDKHNPEFSEALHLYKDNTFNYQLSTMFVPYPRLKGTWNLEGKNVILNSPATSVLGNDTLRLISAIYNVKNGNLKRPIYKSNKYRTLKKKTTSNSFVLDYEKF